jgi:hypothetical protein
VGQAQFAAFPAANRDRLARIERQVLLLGGRRRHWRRPVAQRHHARDIEDIPVAELVPLDPGSADPDAVSGAQVFRDVRRATAAQDKVVPRDHVRIHLDLVVGFAAHRDDIALKRHLRGPGRGHNLQPWKERRHHRRMGTGSHRRSNGSDTGDAALGLPGACAGRISDSDFTLGQGKHVSRLHRHGHARLHLPAIHPRTVRAAKVHEHQPARSRHK